MKNIIRRFFALVIYAVAALSTAYAQPENTIIQLGMVAPLSGDFAPFGVHVQKGIELAQSELERKGIPTRLIAEDGCLPTQVRSALTKLTSTDKIAALVGSYCVIGMLASESILESTKTIGFQTSGATKEILGVGDYLFTTAAKTTDEALALADHVYKKLGLRQAAVFYLTSQWGEEFSQAFGARFKALGGTITGVISNPIGQNSFRSELVKLRGGDPDALIFVHIASSLGIIIKEAREVGHKGRLFGTSDGEEQSVLDLAGKGAEGLLLLSPEPNAETDEMKKFRDQFVVRFGHQPHPLSRHSYDATLLTTAALKGCKMDRQCAKDTLYKTEDYKGASGTFSINADGGTNRSFIVKIVRGGRFERE
jgi:branched-chain amino acid transport system substrate-binding protein